MRVKGYVLVHADAVDTLIQRMSTVEGEETVGGYVRIGEWGDWIAILMLSTTEHIAALRPLVQGKAVVLDTIAHDADAVSVMVAPISKDARAAINNWFRAVGLQRLPDDISLVGAIREVMQLFNPAFDPFAFDIGGLPVEVE